MHKKQTDSLNNMHFCAGLPVCTCAAMREAEQAAIRAGTTGAALMERAGRALGGVVGEQASHAARIAVLAGPGNNGGDGYVAARFLAGRGHDVRVFGLPLAQDGDAARMARAWQGAMAPAEPAALQAFAPDIIIDALFGTGLSRALSGVPLSLVETVNRLHEKGAVVVAADLPSGFNGDAGEAPGAAVAADVTVAFHGLKPVHVLQPSRQACGTIRVVDIGIGPECGSPSFRVNGPPVLRSGAVEAHKYDHGSALVLAGGLEGTGAARLAARGALRAGAGLVTLAVPGEALAVHAGRVPDALMVRRCDGVAGLEALLADSRRNALVLGPAYGVGEATETAVRLVLQARRRVVLDADALTSFAGRAEALGQAIRRSEADVVVTPHAGEFNRLFKGFSSDDHALNHDLTSPSKIRRALAAARILGAVVICKGADTVIAAPDGRVTVNVDAPAWLATAGSGDVLAGITGGLLARGLESFAAAAGAVWLHGAAGRLAGRGLIADDLPEALAAVLRDL